MERSNGRTGQSNGMTITTKMLRTLIVEDNPDYRVLLKDLLHKQFPDMVIAEVENGEDALRQLALFRPHVIFMDINLPGKSGLSITQKIRDLGSEAHIILLTSHDLPEYRTAAIDVGANHFMAKDKSSGKDILAVIGSLIDTPSPR